MKTAKNGSLILMAVLLLGLVVICSSAHAEVSYLGEFCIWDGTPGVFGPPMLRVKFGALYYGNNHFVLNGSNPAFPEPMQGTGMVYGNTFVATLVSSLVDATSTSFTVTHLVLNPGTGGPARIGDGTITGMTFDLTQPTAQSKVLTLPIYVTTCGP